MTDAEKRGLEAYHPHMQYTSMISAAIKNETDTNEPKRRIFIQGYKQAQTDFMEKAEKWWYDHLVGFLKEGLTDGVINEFKEFMKDEH